MESQSQPQSQPLPVKELTAPEQFFKYFQRQITGIQDQMNRLNDKALVGGERKDAADHCLASITRLASEIKDASTSLPSYDIRTYSEAIKALQDKLTEIQASFVPKQKFSFKTKKNASAISIQDAADLATQPRGRNLGYASGNPSANSSFSTTPIHLITPPNEFAASQRDTQEISDQALTDRQPAGNRLPESNFQEGVTKATTVTKIASQTSSHIIVPASISHDQTPCQLSELTRCCVDLSNTSSEATPSASLTINQVQSSLLLCGSVSGPSHITGVKDSVLVMSCHQFRMHECDNVDVYLHCTSRPIIEDCRNIRFTKLPDLYYTFLFPPARGTVPENHWDQVDDFKWLRAEQSPNWSILPSKDLIDESTWQQIIAGQSHKTIDEILDAVKIA